MSDDTTRTVTLAARYVAGPNGGPFTSMQDAVAAGHDTLNPETGTYQVGVVDDGVFIPIYEDAAAHIFGLIAAGKAAQAASAPPAPPAPSGPDDTTQSQ